MNEGHRFARAIVIGVMTCYAGSFVAWSLIVWGTLGGWQIGVGAGIALAVVSVVVGLWKIGKWTWIGLFPRWIPIFCCGVLIGLLILGFTHDMAKPIPDPAEQAKWEAEFGWLTPVGYTIGCVMALVGFLLYLPPVGRFLAGQRLLLEKEPDDATVTDDFTPSAT